MCKELCFVLFCVSAKMIYTWVWYIYRFCTKMTSSLAPILEIFFFFLGPVWRVSGFRVIIDDEFRVTISDDQLEVL